MKRPDLFWLDDHPESPELLAYIEYLETAQHGTASGGQMTSNHITQIRENLKVVRHALDSNYGLLATDQQGVIMDTDANKSMCFAIDYQNEIAAMDEVEASLAGMEQGVRSAVSAIDRAMTEMDVEGRSAGYSGRIFLNAARAALTGSIRPSGEPFVTVPVTGGI